MSPMSKFLNRRWLPVSRPCCWRHNYAGQGTSPECRIIVCLRCMANSPPATATEVHQRKDTKTLWGSPSEFVILTAASGLLSLLTALPGAILFTKLSPPSRPPAKRTWERNAAGGRSEQLQQLHQSRARPLTVATAAWPACPVLDLLVIRAPAIGVDCHLYLIFASEVKPRRRVTL